MRVLVADDHPMYRDGLAAALVALGHEVVGTAGDGEEAVALAASSAPDAVLMDLHMPGMNGIEATRRIAEAGGPAVLVLSMLEDDGSVFAAMRAGARGYLVKGAAREEIGRAVEAVANGEVIFGPAVAQRALAAFAGGRSTGSGPLPELTDREREILDLVARGLSNPAIAQRLVLSEKTVRNHVSNVFSKLAVESRAAAIVKAREVGLGDGTR